MIDFFKDILHVKLIYSLHKPQAQVLSKYHSTFEIVSGFKTTIGASKLQLLHNILRNVELQVNIAEWGGRGEFGEDGLKPHHN